MGYVRLSLISSTAQALYTSFPVIFSSCFSKVTIGYNPTRPAMGRRVQVGLGRIVALYHHPSTLYQIH
jgi:hypothetical protein